MKYGEATHISATNPHRVVLSDEIVRKLGTPLQAYGWFLRFFGKSRNGFNLEIHATLPGCGKCSKRGVEPRQVSPLYFGSNCGFVLAFRYSLSDFLPNPDAE